MTEVRYPRFKVFMIFILCPLVPGFVAGLINSVLLVAHIATHPRLIGEVHGAEILLMPLLTPLVAVVVFFLPLFGLALGVSLLKVRRSARSCNALALLGAVLATGWVSLFIHEVVTHSERARYEDYWLGVFVVFLAALVTCWSTARLFLPKKSMAPHQ